MKKWDENELRMIIKDKAVWSESLNRKTLEDALGRALRRQNFHCYFSAVNQYEYVQWLRRMDFNDTPESRINFVIDAGVRDFNDRAEPAWSGIRAGEYSLDDIDVYSVEYLPKITLFANGLNDQWDHEWNRRIDAARAGENEEDI